MAMNLLITSDDRQAAYIPALICSICENHRSEQISFYVMHRKIGPEIIGVIRRTCQRYNADMFEIVPPAGAFTMFSGEMDAIRGDHRFPEETYYHLLAHRYLPDKLDRILYLDVDIVVNGNVHGMYDCDFGDSFVAVADRYGNLATKHGSVRNTSRPIYRFGGNRFNSGVILYNLQKMRDYIDEDFFRTIIDKMKKNGSLRYVCWDEGFANLVFHDKAVYFDDVYNSIFQSSKPAIILHAGAHPFKPWQYHLSENTRFEDMCYPRSVGRKKWMLAAKPINAVWWKYAMMAPNGSELLREAEQNAEECRHGAKSMREKNRRLEMVRKREVTLRFSGCPNVPGRSSKVSSLKNRTPIALRKETRVEIPDIDQSFLNWANDRNIPAQNY